MRHLRAICLMECPRSSLSTDPYSNWRKTLFGESRGKIRSVSLYRLACRKREAERLAEADNSERYLLIRLVSSLVISTPFSAVSWLTVEKLIRELVPELRGHDFKTMQAASTQIVNRRSPAF